MSHKRKISDGTDVEPAPEAKRTVQFEEPVKEPEPKQPFQWQLSLAVAQTMKGQVFTLELDYHRNKVGCFYHKPTFSDLDLRSPLFEREADMRVVEVHLGGHLLIAIREHDHRHEIPSPERFPFWLVDYEGYTHRYGRNDDDREFPRWVCEDWKGTHTFLHRCEVPREEYAYLVDERQHAGLNENGLRHMCGTEWRHGTTHMWWLHRHYPHSLTKAEQQQVLDMPQATRVLYEQRVDIVERLMSIRGCTKKSVPDVENDEWSSLRSVLWNDYNQPFMMVPGKFAPVLRDPTTKPAWTQAVGTIVARVQAREMDLGWAVCKDDDGEVGRSQLRAAHKLRVENASSEEEKDRLFDDFWMARAMRRHYEKDSKWRPVDPEAVYYRYDEQHLPLVRAWDKIVRAVNLCLLQELHSDTPTMLAAIEDTWDALDSSKHRAERWGFRSCGKGFSYGAVAVVQCTNGDLRISFCDALKDEDQSKLQAWLKTLDAAHVTQLPDRRWVLSHLSGWTIERVREQLPRARQY